MGKSILIMGNGPSFKQVELQRLKIDTFGMNNAYKFYGDMGWYPTFWGCFDLVMTNHNSQGHLDFFKNGRCAHYYTLNEKAKAMPNVSCVLSKAWLPRTLKHYKNRPFQNVGHTAANCVQVAIDKGYTNIYIIGVDGHPANGRSYAFDGYQGEKERFNPLHVEMLTMPTWRHLSSWAKPNGIEVVNCNPDSVLLKGLFKTKTLEESGIYL